MIKKYLEFIKENTKYNIGPLFHGSKHRFEIFDFEKLGGDWHILSFLGVHFSENEKIAESFIGPPDYTFYEIELKVNNPLDIKENDLVRNMIKFGVENNIINKSIFNRQTVSNSDNDKIFDDILSLPYFNNSYNEIPCLNTKICDCLRPENSKKIAEEYKKYLIQQGYDSIKYKNEIEKPHIIRYDWIAFNQEQIKIIEIWDQKPILKSEIKKLA